MDLEKIKKDWDYYCKETEENEIVDIDLHYLMAMEVGGLIEEIERLQQSEKDLFEISQRLRQENIQFTKRLNKPTEEEMFDSMS